MLLEDIKKDLEQISSKIYICNDIDINQKIAFKHQKRAEVKTR